jgi:hypothetical protein
MGWLGVPWLGLNRRDKLAACVSSVIYAIRWHMLWLINFERRYVFLEVYCTL